LYKKVNKNLNGLQVYHNHELDRESLYVGLSRTTKLENLFLDGEFKLPLKINEIVKNEMNRLKSNPLIPNIIDLSKINN
jgi:hypothetical protein